MHHHPKPTPKPQGTSASSAAAPDAKEWAASARELARWTAKRLVNRTDVWGQYLPLDRRDKGKAQTRKGQLAEDVLVRHYEGKEVSDLIGLHTTSAANKSRWLAVDIDNHGDPDEKLQRRHEKAAKALYARAKHLGFNPLLLSSNGRGGYHVILLFDQSVPTPTVFAFGQWLVRDWQQQLGLTEAPEVFPKQPRLGGATKYGNWLRLPGRHHTHPYHSEVWTGKRWAKGKEAIEVILATEGVCPTSIPAEAHGVAVAAPDTAVAPAPRVPLEQLDGVQRRALALLQKKLRAVEGKGGDKATWTAALYLVKDYALTVEQALPVLKAWNATHCRPPWDEGDLLRKLRRAEEEPGPRGRLLGGVEGGTAAVASAAPQQPTGKPFGAAVPDFILTDWAKLAPSPASRKPGQPSAVRDVGLGLIFAAVVQQRSSCVYLPDVVLGQLLWGAARRWPRRWRRTLRRRWRRSFAACRVERTCPAQCPLHGRLEVPHHHLRVRLSDPEVFLGSLHLFQVAHDEAGGTYTYDFTKRTSHHPDPATAAGFREAIDAAIDTGRLFSVYLPAWLFGPAVLAAGPCRVVQALTHELTRRPGRRRERQARPDNAEVVAGEACPLLGKGRRYVAFNGNGHGHYHGGGYRLASWLERAGYSVAEGEAFWAEARRFLKHLRALVEPFGLVAGGYRQDQGTWEPLDRLIDLTRNQAGRRWLKACRLKVFGPEDYLVRWRRHFAQALGFGSIPGGAATEAAAAAEHPGAVPGITSALELDGWMRRNGLTDRTLAKALGVSQALVSYQHSGKRRWSLRFQQRLAAHLGKEGAAESGSGA